MTGIGIMLRRLNDALPGLVFGILIYGVLVQITGVWFVADKVRYSIGLWYGIAIAIGMSVNMAKIIYDSVTVDAVPGSNKANRKVIAKSILRYAVVVILFFILGYFGFGNLFTAFVGVMGLKISAYMQPLFDKIRGKRSGGSDAPAELQTGDSVLSTEGIAIPDAKNK